MIGVLHLRSLDENAYVEHHLDLIRKVAAQIAPAVANAYFHLTGRRVRNLPFRNAARS